MLGNWWSRWRPAQPLEKASAGQTDLFISYSRTDIAFCRELAGTIRGAGRTLWMDEEGIAPTEEWLAAIFKAIEACRCFVFVISPASVQSRFCRMEIEHAVQHNKKLIPVLWQPVEDASILPEAFKRVQWLEVDKYPDVTAVGAALLESADRDGPWIAFHTRLLVRALDWDRANRARARLLTAGETRDAQASLKHGAGKEPEPTALQETFVTTSRRNTIRIRTAASVLLGLGIAGTVAGIMLYRGVEAARASDAQFRTADWAFSDGELPRAVTHLMRAVSINPSNRDAQERLYDLLVAQPVLVARLATTNDPVRAMAFDDRRNQLVAVSESGRGLRLAAGAKDFEPLEAKGNAMPERGRPDVARQLLRWRLAADGQTIPVPLPLMALDPDNGRAALRAKGSVILYDTGGSGKLRHVSFESTVQSVHFLEVANLVAVRLAEELRLWNVDTGATCLAVELQEDKPLLMSRNGRWISVHSDPGGLEERSYEELVGGQLELRCDGEEEQSPASPTVRERFENASIAGFDLVPDGHVAAVTATSQEVVTLRFTGQEALPPIKRRLRGVKGVFLRPDGLVAYVADRDGGLAAWSTLTGQAEFAPLRHATEPVAVVHDAAGERLFVLTADGLLSIWDVSGKSSASLRFRDAAGIAAVPSDEPGRTTANGRALKARSGTSGVWELSSSGSFSHPLEGDDEKDTDTVWEQYGIYPGTNAAVSRNGSTLATIAGRSAPRIWDVRSGAERTRLTEAVSRERFSQAVWLSDSGDRALVQFSNATNNGPQVSFAVFNTSSSGRAVAFAPKWLLPDQLLLDVSSDLARLLVGSGARVEVVDADTLLPIARTTADGDAVLHARFLDNGQRFLTIDRERRYRIWNAENGLAVGAQLRLAADPARGQARPTERLEDYARVPPPRIVERDGFSGLWLPSDDKAAPDGRAAIVALVQHFSATDVKRLVGLAEAMLGMRTKPDGSIELLPVEEIGPMRQRWVESQGSTTSPIMDLARQKLRQRDPIEGK